MSSESKDQSVDVGPMNAATEVGEVEVFVEEAAADRALTDLTIGTYPWRTTEAQALLNAFNDLCSAEQPSARKLTEQRDALRKRVEELESENASMAREIEDEHGR